MTTRYIYIYTHHYSRRIDFVFFFLQDDTYDNPASGEYDDYDSIEPAARARTDANRKPDESRGTPTTESNLADSFFSNWSTLGDLLANVTAVDPAANPKQVSGKWQKRKANVTFCYFAAHSACVR